MDFSSTQIKDIIHRWIPSGLLPINYCKKYVAESCQQSIFSGPFQGLEYVSESVGSVYYPKLLGTYEKELHPVVDGFVDGDFDECLVIGAGEGYYAAGLAKLLNLPVVAYELDEQGQSHIRELAKINEVQLSVNSRFEWSQLSVTQEKRLVVIDIEGGEQEIINCTDAQLGLQTTWLIELHGRKIKKKLERRLMANYQISFIPVKARTMTDYPFELPRPQDLMLERYWMSLLQEWRSDSIGWMLAIPKALV